MLCVSNISRSQSRFLVDRILHSKNLNTIKKTLHIISWDPWHLSRLFVRIKLASRYKITVVFNRASFTLLGAQVYFLCRFLVIKFGVLQLIVLINVLNDSDSKTRNNNSSTKYYFTLTLVYSERLLYYAETAFLVCVF